MGDNIEQTREYNAAKTSVVFYERQDVACLRVRGADRLDLLNRLSTNDLLSLKPGGGTVTVLTNEKGRIVDLLTVYCNADHLLVLCANGNQSAVIQHLAKYTITEDFVCEDISQTVSVVSVFGPDAGAMLEKGFRSDRVVSLPLFHFSQTDSEYLFTRGAWLNGNGYHIVFPRSRRQLVMEILAQCSAMEISDGIYEILRIEAGTPAFGKELSDKHNPLEAGLQAAVSFTKGCYLGQEVIARLHSYHKVQRKLCRAIIETQEKLQTPAPLYDGEKEIGMLTSCVLHPISGESVGFCYVPIGMPKTTALNMICENKKYSVIVNE